MSGDLRSSFSTDAERNLLGEPTYMVFDWYGDHRLSYATVEVSLGCDGFQQLALDAELGRRVRRWRDRNPELAALLDAEAALDAFAAER